MSKVISYPSLLAALVLIASCGASGASSPVTSSTGTLPQSSGPQSSGSSQVTAAPGTFTSTTYGYTLTPPEQWTSAQASGRWDGQSGLDIESSQVDKFRSPSTDPAFWAVATPWRQSLAAFTSFTIFSIASFHGDTCPAEPNRRSAIVVGGEPGVLLAYDCGILINQAVTVHRGVGYWFVFRDQGVQAATDPADHATFLRILGSVQFPA
jgi:hypothetical protein